MKKLNLHVLTQYVEQNIGIFHEKRIKSLDNLKLSQVLKRKNPYLFKAKYMLTAEQIIKGLVDAHISSNEETVFGDWLEGLAIFINSFVYNGRKSGITGIDLEFDKNNIRHIVTIKSGPNWGNSSQIKKMISDFTTAKKILRTSNSRLNMSFLVSYSQMINKFTKEFSNSYCNDDGLIDWNKLVKYNSSSSV